MRYNRKYVGRPYGGLAFIVKQKLVESILDLREVFKITTHDYELFLLNEYMPVNTKTNENHITESG